MEEFPGRRWNFYKNITKGTGAKLALGDVGLLWSSKQTHKWVRAHFLVLRSAILGDGTCLKEKQLFHFYKLNLEYQGFPC